MGVTRNPNQPFEAAGAAVAAMASALSASNWKWSNKSGGNAFKEEGETGEGRKDLLGTVDELPKRGGGCGVNLYEIRGLVDVKAVEDTRRQIARRIFILVGWGG